MMETNRTTLVQRPSKAGLETGAPAEQDGRSDDFRADLGRAMETNRTTLAQWQSKAGLESGAPAKRASRPRRCPPSSFAR